jgi:hypothetical protein
MTGGPNPVKQQLYALHSDESSALVFENKVDRTLQLSNEFEFGIGVESNRPAVGQFARIDVANPDYI